MGIPSDRTPGAITHTDITTTTCILSPGRACSAHRMTWHRLSRYGQLTGRESRASFDARICKLGLSA
ncbi:hypothetical protein QYF61_016595 [Mycteria americana]|uniref:Uncharacterized protein n=1 Tax=Mycteria americana TaxID=33587 RepID=A0AAN7N2N7_MYCAM|nr:hypothetical protein QYF61_016595 [Mycteria americana]